MQLLLRNCVRRSASCKSSSAIAAITPPGSRPGNVTPDAAGSRGARHQARGVPRQVSGFPGRPMACGLVFRVMTDDPAGCRVGPAGAEGHGAAASRCAAFPWRLRPRILSSRGESVEEHPWARQDRRNLAGRCGTIDGAGRVRCVAAGGVPARPALPRHGLPPRRLPRAAPRGGGARARRRAREQRRGGAGGRCMGACPAGLARRRARRVRAHPAHRGRVPAGPRDRHDGAHGGSARCPHGDVCCTRRSA